MTKLAAEMLDLIRSSERHMTAEEVFMLCKEKGIKISFASVYRILTNFVDDGIMRKVSIPGEPDRFDKTVRPHDHIFCSRCKKVCDIDIGDLTEMLEKKIGSRIDGYTLSVKYICPECRRLESSEAEDKKSV